MDDRGKAVQLYENLNSIANNLNSISTNMDYLNDSLKENFMIDDKPIYNEEIDNLSYDVMDLKSAIYNGVMSGLKSNYL